MAQPDGAVPHTPERQEAQADRDRLGPSDDLPGARDRSTEDTAAELNDAAEMIVAGAVMASRDVATATYLLGLAPLAAFQHPTSRFILEVAHQVAMAGELPSPLAIMTWAARHNLDVPVRPFPLSELSRVAADSTTFGPAEWAAVQIRENHYRRTIAAAAHRIGDSAWADHEQLVEVVLREVEIIRVATEAVVGA